MKIINLTNNVVLANEARVADTFWKRLVGLLNCNSLGKEEALILRPCSSIHTFFMRFPIDVLFLDKNNKVIGLLYEFKAFRVSRIYFDASLAIEFASGTLKPAQAKLGNSIKIE